MSVVYVIDDDTFTRNAIEMLLQSEGFAVKAFSSARDFFETKSSGDIGCILTDVEMPGGVTGLDLLAEVSKTTPECPVVVMTGRGNGAFRSAAYGLGACEYLEKPFSAESLIDAITKATLPAMRVGVGARRVGSHGFGAR
jgi:two-component system, LuxR family, response regulator FixJ